jgi:hypothetical protein
MRERIKGKTLVARDEGDAHGVLIKVYGEEREHQKAGGQAARGSSSRCKSGYQRWNTAPSSWFRVFARICNRRCAPRLVHCICCFLQKRLLITWFDRRLHKTSADSLAIAVALAVVRDEGSITLDISVKLLHSLQQLPGRALACGRHGRFEIHDEVRELLEGFIDVAMPQRLLESLQRSDNRVT